MRHAFRLTSLAALAASVACCGAVVSCGTGEQSPEGRTATPRPQASAPNSMPAPATGKTPTSREPGWLPAGATLFTRTSVGTNNRGVLLIYSLPGAANTNPAAQLQVSTIPGIVNPPPPYTDPAHGVLGESVTVSGVPGTLVYPQNGLGTWRVSWLTGTNLHTVSVERLQGPYGTSGIDRGDLLRVADSITE
jgi:hypothetical protein